MINNVIISLSVKGKVVLPWKMNLPHESQLASKPHFFYFVFSKIYCCDDRERFIASSVSARSFPKYFMCR